MSERKARPGTWRVSFTLSDDDLYAIASCFGLEDATGDMPRHVVSEWIERRVREAIEHAKTEEI